MPNTIFRSQSYPSSMATSPEEGHYSTTKRDETSKSAASRSGLVGKKNIKVLSILQEIIIDLPLREERLKESGNIREVTRILLFYHPVSIYIEYE